MAVEILAPAGSFEALTAAVRAGADAVYFGTGDFNARRHAANFNGDELLQAIAFCHARGVKCHIALNTLVGDAELPKIKEIIKRVCEANADALILQDLGVARIVREMCPEMELHASTQMSVGTLGGLSELEKLGFKRAVLPRELSREEIQALCGASPIDLEMFVHGALCMCVSGQCLLSAMLGSRSGNRGLCAQPCRLPFSVSGGTGQDLSLKDLSLVEDIPALSAMGIASLKIEGRMKRPEYVAAAVTACREALGGQFSVQRADELESLFSRSGFTKGYYENIRGRAMFGKREKENVTAATSALLKKYARLYEKERSVFPVNFVFSAFEGEHISLSVSAAGKNVFVQSDVLAEKAISRPITQELVAAQLAKCGGTIFFVDDIACELGENVSVPMSAVNALRREALEQLSKQIAARKPQPSRDFEIETMPHTPADSLQKYLLFRNTAAIPETLDCDKIFLPLDTAPELFKRYHAGAIIPRGMFGNAQAIVEKLKGSGARYALCNTLDAVAAAKTAGVEIIGGPFLNIFNTQSLNEAKALGLCACTLSYELTAAQIERLGADIARGAVVYGKTPLMLTRNCPEKNGKTCAQCGKSGILTDRKGISFPIRCENGFSEIFNSRPTYMADRLREMRNIDFMLFDFTTERKEEVSRILQAYENSVKPEGEFTRGLFYRGVE